MAKSCVRLTAGEFVAGGTTNNTASITPAASSAVVIAIFAFGTTTMSVSGNGLTWATKVNGELGGDGGRLWIFIGAGASPSAGVITLTYDNDAFVDWVVDNITGTVNLTTPGNTNFIAATGTSTGPAATLGAFAHVSNGTWGMIYAQDSVTLTPGTGFTTVASRAGSAMFGHSDYSIFRDSNDTSVDGTLSGSAIWGIAALEIVDTAAAGGSSPRNLLLMGVG